MPKKTVLPPLKIVNGSDWRDTDGRPIQAHGGGILLHKGTYYWYGEEHSKGFGNQTGIACYSSPDLLEWKFCSLALPKEALPEKFRDQGVCERPKVLYCQKTRQFVMWMHLDADGYSERLAGVATCDRPDGLFVLEDMHRPISFPYDYQCMDGGGLANTEEQHRRLAKLNERERGNTFADFNLLQEKDGTAWIFYASENNSTLYVSRLRDDYLDIERPEVEGQTWARTHIRAWREAPAPFHHRGVYYLLTSGCTGWNPNPMLLSMAEHPLGPWHELGNPCLGPSREVSFHSQPACVIPAPGNSKNHFIYCGDRWDASDLRRSTYVWLPFYIDREGAIRLEYLAEWDFSVFQRTVKKLPAPVVSLEEGKRGTSDRLVWKPVPGAHFYRIYRNNVYTAVTVDRFFELPAMFPGNAAAWTVVAARIDRISSPPAHPVVEGTVADKGDIYLSDFQPDKAVQGYGNLGRDRNVMGGDLCINGRRYKKGLGTHAVSEIIYRIGGVFSQFTATIGLDDSHQGGSVVFLVIADEICIYQSGVIRSGDQAKKIKCNMRGVFELKLVVTDAGDGSHCDHANWCDARLKC